MTPKASLTNNVFEFDAAGARARAVIWGPWVYVAAPGIRLPHGMESTDPERKRGKRIGLLQAKILVTEDGGIRLLERFLGRLLARKRRAVR